VPEKREALYTAHSSQIKWQRAPIPRTLGYVYTGYLLLGTWGSKTSPADKHVNTVPLTFKLLEIPQLNWKEGNRFVDLSSIQNNVYHFH
jgi:hypothetical protein